MAKRPKKKKNSQRLDKMTNQEKFDEHRKLIAACKAGHLLDIKPDVYSMEKLKYSDDPEVRKACAIIEYADFLWLEKLLGR